MRAEDYRIPYRIVLGIIFGNFGEKITEPKLFGINSVIFLCAMVYSARGGTRIAAAVAGQVPHAHDCKKHFCSLPTCFHASFFPFCPLCWPRLFLPFSRPIAALFSPLQGTLFCRAKGTEQSLDRVSFRMDLSTKFGKEIPSRNLRGKRSV